MLLNTVDQPCTGLSKWSHSTLPSEGLIWEEVEDTR